MSSYKEVDELLNLLDEIQELVTRRKQKINHFLDHLEQQLKKKKILRNCDLILVGSAAEKTSVREYVDFDVILTLSQPFTRDYFEIHDVSNDGEIGVYKLQRIDDENDECSYEYDRNTNSSSLKLLNGYTNQNGYLKVRELKEAIFNELECAVREMAKEEASVRYDTERKNSSFCIIINSKMFSAFKIDLVPQIKGCKRDIIDDWNDRVPSVVKDYLQNHREHTHFNLSYPFWLDDENYEHLSVYATFCELEGHCMGASDYVRNAVRLTKAVSQHYGWTKKGLHSFHIKRTAIALFDTLDDMDPWDGYQAILAELIKQLRKDVIWGVFLRDHDIALEDKNTCHQLANEMKLAKQNICPSNILKKLSVYF